MNTDGLATYSYTKNKILYYHIKNKTKITNKYILNLAALRVVRRPKKQNKTKHSLYKTEGALE